MKNIKSVLKFYKIILYGFLLSVLGILSVWVYLHFDQHGNCLDNGGVWDEKQQNVGLIVINGKKISDVLFLMMSRNDFAKWYENNAKDVPLVVKYK